MSAVPAARFLADFGADGDAGSIRARGIASSKDDSGAEVARLDEAFARGVAEGRAEAQVQFETKLEEQRSEFATRLASERQGWATGTGEDLAKRLLGAVAEVEQRVAETTARILKPFLTEQLHRQAIAELQASLDNLLTSDPDVSLGISGPADVLDALRKRLSGKMAVTYTPSDDCDVRIVAGQATLETRLKDWMARLAEAVP